MKKILYCFAALLSINNAQAQMNEMIGVLGVSGAINHNAYNNVGQMQVAMSRMQLQQDITLLVNEIQTTFMPDYMNLDVSLLNFRGFRGLQWDVIPVSSAEFYIELHNLNASACFIVKNNPWGANRVEINNGQDCQNLNNFAKLYF
ncbi:MAG: hypothetical protein IJW75_03450 [Alphaproteobacteria bacterium]|nr:hypothetical protein [Alphaproteobacteria bacterium]